MKAQRVTIQESGPEKDAAKYLGLAQSRFRKLVTSGALPAPIKLADGTQIWDLVQIGDILRGDAAKPSQDIEF